MLARSILVVMAAFVAVAQTPGGAAAPQQPLPFSHKTHAAKGLACKNCHGAADRADLAGFPPTAKCMTCHVTAAKDSPAIAKLAELDRKGEPVPWRRVYRVPDYVTFSHKVHVAKAQTACETCHGPVAESDAIRKEKPTSMASCVDCHKSKGASVACDFCHEPR